MEGNTRVGRLLLACLLLAACGRSLALYDQGSAVQSVSPKTFSRVTDSKLPVVVEFYAPWCGHCKSLAPKFIRAAEKLKNIIPFVAVDCDVHKALCGQHGVQGFPTIKTFVKGRAMDYTGQRTAAALVEAASGLLSSKHITKVSSTAGAVALIASAKGQPTVLLLTDKSAASPLYKSLSMRFEGQLKFGLVHSKAADVIKQYSSGSLPALVVVAADGTHSQYQGELTATKMVEFLRGVAGVKEAKKQAGENRPAEDATASNRKAGREEEATKGSSGGTDEASKAPAALRNISLSDLRGMLDKDGVVILAVHSGEGTSCTERLAELEGAVRGLNGLVPAVQLNASSEEDAATLADKYGVKLDDTSGAAGCQLQVYLLPHEDKDSDDWMPYQGQLTSKDLRETVIELFPDALIAAVSHKNLDIFIGTELTRTKVVLFADKKGPPALLRALAVNLKDWKMDFGLASGSDTELKQRLSVRKVPSLVVVYARPSKDPAAAEDKDIEIGIQPYGGPLRYDQVYQFLQFIGIKLGAAPDNLLDEMLAKEAGDVPLAQLKDQQTFEEECLQKGGICLIAVLDPSHRQHAAHLGILRSISVMRAGQPFHLSWVDAGQHLGFVRSLGASASDVPGMVVFSPKKQRAATMRTPFERDSIQEFIDGVLGASISTAPLQDLPTFVQVSEEEEQGEVLEDEFDLSDIMNESVMHVSFPKARDEL